MENSTKNPTKIAKMDDLGVPLGNLHITPFPKTFLGPWVPSGSDGSDLPQAKGWPAVRGIVEVILGLFGMFAQKMLALPGDLSIS